MRSHPFSSPQQFVFGKDISSEYCINDPKGKGKAPMYTMNSAPHIIQPMQTLPERRYFTRATPQGVLVSENNATPAAAKALEPGSTKDVAAAVASKKKGRFSIFKKSDIAV